MFVVCLYADYLFQMDLDRLRCLGRSSEYLGKKAISNDKLNIKRNFEIVAKEDLKKASSSAQQMIESFTEGVNYYLSNLDNLPFEYQLLNVEPEPWENWHSILVYKIRNAAEGSFNGKLFYSQLANEIGPEKAAKLIPGYFPGALLTLPPGDKYTGEIENAVLNALGKETPHKRLPIDPHLELENTDHWKALPAAWAPQIRGNKLKYHDF